METNQIKSKERVTEHGEVFTNKREVNAMLDMVKDETDRIDSRFLEPACGNGAFMTEILRRKLAVVIKQYKKSHADFAKYSILALMSIYGVDLLEDNVQECQERLYNIWNETYTKYCKDDASEACREAAKYILKCNVLCGDALTMLQNNDDPIIFAQWDFVKGTLVKRRDYRLDQLLKSNEDQVGMEAMLYNWEYDEKLKEWVPSPIKEYDLVDYWEVQNND